MYREVLFIFCHFLFHSSSHPEVCLFRDPGQPKSEGGRGRDEYMTNLWGAVRVTVTFSFLLPHPDSEAETNSALLHLSVSSPWLHSSSELDGRLQTSFRSYEDLSERVGPGAADVALGGVERHVVDRLLELLAVGGELLDARLDLHVPQTDRAVVTWREERQSMRMEDGGFHHAAASEPPSGLL